MSMSQLREKTQPNMQAARFHLCTNSAVQPSADTSKDQLIDTLSTQVVVLKHQLKGKECYYNLTVDDLEKEQKVEVKNAAAAAKIWQQLKNKGTPTAAEKFKEAFKRYESLCLIYRIKPVLS